MLGGGVFLTVSINNLQNHNNKLTFAKNMIIILNKISRMYCYQKNSIYNTNVYFNKCSKNSPTSSGGEMNCTSEHICSKKTL